MKKYICLLCFCIMLVSCGKSETPQQQEYYKLVELVEKTDQHQESKYFKIDVKKTIFSGQKKLYEIILSNPKIKVDDLKILAYPIGYENDELLPNFNIFEEVDISSFNNHETGIKLNYFSAHDYTDFKVLVEYQKDNKTVREIYKVAI